MPNRTYAKEWLEIAIRNLITARHLFDVEHFTDIIGIEIQQSIEKALKSILAYHNQKIPKEHDLVKLYFVLDDKLKLNDDEIVKLKIATNYFKEDRYPNPNYCLPPRDEIEDILEFSERLFEDICNDLGVDKSKLNSRGI